MEESEGKPKNLDEEEKDLEYDEDSEYEADKVKDGSSNDEDDDDDGNDDDNDDDGKKRQKGKKRQRKKKGGESSSKKKRSRTLLDDAGDLAAIEADEVAALQEDIANSFGESAPGKGKKKNTAKPAQGATPIDKYSRESGSAFSSAVSEAMAKMMRDASLAEKPVKMQKIESSSLLKSKRDGPLPGTAAFSETAIAKRKSSESSKLLGNYSSLGSPSTVAVFVRHSALAACTQKYINDVDSFLADLRTESVDSKLKSEQEQRLRIGEAKKILLPPCTQKVDAMIEDAFESSPASLTNNSLDRDKAMHEMAKAALKRVASRKVAVSKTVKFAGETRTVTQYVDSSSSSFSASSSSSSSSLSSSIGAIVSGLDKPEAISTLSKTNLDWEQYKTKEGLDESFEARAQQYGFVERQDFLSRVDDRSAQADLQRRIEERRQRESAQLPR